MLRRGRVARAWCPSAASRQAARAHAASSSAAAAAAPRAAPRLPRRLVVPPGLAPGPARHGAGLLWLSAALAAAGDCGGGSGATPPARANSGDRRLGMTSAPLRSAARGCGP